MAGKSLSEKHTPGAEEGARCLQNAKEILSKSPVEYNSYLDDKRIFNRLPVAREGIPFIVAGAILAFFFAGLGLDVPGLVMGLLTLFIAWFFRDPDRVSPADQKVVLSPADGRILGTWHLSGADNPLGGPCEKVSIFMSVFNVHVNRIPASGTISSITYHPGKFLQANLDKASEHNENNRVTLETNGGKRIVVVQVAGLIARRIACWIKVGDRVAAGQRFGLIRFGSRLDVYLHGEGRLVVKPGDRVKAGETVVEYLS